MKDEYLRAFSFFTLLLYIPSWTAVDDEIVRCICGIIVLLNGAHSRLECLELVVFEIVRESDASICQIYMSLDEGPAKGLPIFFCTRFAVSMKRKVRHVCRSLARLSSLFFVTADKCIGSLGQ